MERLRVLWHWQTMGPYHFARMRALAAMPGLDLTVVESTSLDDHGWARTGSSGGNLDVVTLSSEPFSRRLLKKTQPALHETLETRLPDLVIAAGYAEASSLNPIIRYRKMHPETLTVLWTDTTALDLPRKWLRESLKWLLLPVFDGAVTASSAAASYLLGLGMAPEDVQVLGNCVDNDFFGRRAEEIRSKPNGDTLPEDYFLFVGRLVTDKNLSTLVDAYRRYRQEAGAGAWSLVLVGAGSEEPALRAKVAERGITGVSFAGLRQADELPQYYARAKCLILASTREPWGLVVNEAMACGLPVLVSDRCGCAQELVRPGVNGFLFDPLNLDSLTAVLRRVSSPDVSLEEMARHSRSIVAEYSPLLFAQRASSHFQSLRHRKKTATGAFTSRGIRRSLAGGLSSIAGFLS